MRVRFLAPLILLLVGALAGAVPVQAAGPDVFNPAVSSFASVNTGWYDHQQIWYDGSTITNDTASAAELIAQGEVVYHIENPDGSTPIQQVTFPVPPTGGISSSGNVVSAIPTEHGYTGGAWNLKIFMWNASATRALTQDDDILAAAAAGEGVLISTPLVVRCPLVNFTALR